MLCVCVCLWFESIPVDSYNLSIHYCSLALRGAPRLGVVVTRVSISKIIRKAKTFNTGMSLCGLITVSMKILKNKCMYMYIYNKTYPLSGATCLCSVGFGHRGS